MQPDAADAVGARLQSHGVQVMTKAGATKRYCERRAQRTSRVKFQ